MKIDIKLENKNSKALLDFIYFCQANPDLRFWQALRNWVGSNFIFLSQEALHYNDSVEVTDTFYFEGKTE